MNNKKKVIISIVIVLLLIVVVSSATYAVYKWRSIYGLNVNISVTDNITVTFNGGTNITGRLKPVDSPTKGIVKRMTIKSNLPNDNSTYSLYLKTNTLPDALKSTQFKWILFDCNLENSDCELPSGLAYLTYSGIYQFGDFSTASMANFIDNNTGDLLLLDSSSIPFRKIQELYLYLWIDGTSDNSPSLGGNHIDFDLYATGSSDTLIELPSQ